MQPALPEDPAPPPAPRLHDRRAQPAAASVRAPRPDPRSARDDPAARRSAPAADAAARAAGGDRRQRRARDVRDHLLPAVVPAGAVRATSTSRRRASTACATSTIAAPRGRDRRPQRQRSSSTPRRRIAVQISPPDLPRIDRRRAARLYHRLATCSGSRPSAPQLPRSTGHGVLHGWRRSRATSPSSIALLPYANVDDQDRRLPATSTYYLAERQDQFPGVSVEQV